MFGWNFGNHDYFLVVWLFWFQECTKFVPVCSWFQTFLMDCLYLSNEMEMISILFRGYVFVASYLGK
jgi:hypothetical protein